MMRRRPIARMAVRTTAVVGTAAVVGGHMANKQAAQAQQAAPEAPARSSTGAGRSRTRSHRAAHPARRAEGLGCTDRGRVRGGEGKDPGLGRGCRSFESQPPLSNATWSITCSGYSSQARA